MSNSLKSLVSLLNQQKAFVFLMAIAFVSYGDKCQKKDDQCKNYGPIPKYGRRADFIVGGTLSKNGKFSDQPSPLSTGYILRPFPYSPTARSSQGGPSQNSKFLGPITYRCVPTCSVVLIYSRDKHANVVLTAAHCLFDPDNNQQPFKYLAVGFGPVCEGVRNAMYERLDDTGGGNSNSYPKKIEVACPSGTNTRRRARRMYRQGDFEYEIKRYDSIYQILKKIPHDKFDPSLVDNTDPRIPDLTLWKNHGNDIAGLILDRDVDPQIATPATPPSVENLTQMFLTIPPESDSGAACRRSQLRFEGYGLVSDTPVHSGLPGNSTLAVKNTDAVFIGRDLQVPSLYLILTPTGTGTRAGDSGGGLYFYPKGIEKNNKPVFVGTLTSSPEGDDTMSKIVSYVDHAGFVDAIRAAADDNFRPGWRWWPPGWVTIESLCTNAGFTPAEYTGNNYPYQEDPFEPDLRIPFDPH